MNDSMNLGRAAEQAESIKKRAKERLETVEREATELGENISRGAADLADAVSSRLKTVGVDTEVMTKLAKNQVSELQRLIGDELSAKPLRALGIAAALGVIVGLMTAR